MRAFPASVLLALAVALTAPGHASAKGCLRIEAPDALSAGQHMRVTVRTFTSVLDGGTVVPGTPTVLAIGGRFTIVAAGPNGRTVSFIVRLTRDQTVRAGKVSLPIRGVWRLRARNWLYAPASCAPPKVVVVR